MNLNHKKKKRIYFPQADSAPAPPLNLSDLLKELDQLADPEKAARMPRFFKTEPGTYGEGDCFRGIMVPDLRILARRYEHADLVIVKLLLRSVFHEDRMLALLILIQHFEAASKSNQKTIYDFYLKCARFVNNWDLVDLSAARIVGSFLYTRKNRNYDILLQLADSPSLWERRIAMVATHYFIQQKVLQPTFEVAVKLLEDSEDLIHKAVGWMLREAARVNPIAQEFFLQKHYYSLHRTTLRYAIEHFSKAKRQRYLKGQLSWFREDWRE